MGKVPKMHNYFFLILHIEANMLCYSTFRLHNLFNLCVQFFFCVQRCDLVLTFQHLAETLIQGNRSNLYTLSIYTTGYLQKQFRLNSSLKGKTVVPLRGFKPTTLALQDQVPHQIATL